MRRNYVRIRSEIWGFCRGLGKFRLRYRTELTNRVATPCRIFAGFDEPLMGFYFHIRLNFKFLFYQPSISLKFVSHVRLSRAINQLHHVYHAGISYRRYAKTQMQAKNVSYRQEWGFASSPNVLSDHRCISIPHFVMMRTRKPLMMAKKTPEQTVR